MKAQHYDVSLFFVAAVVFIDSFGIGVLIPILPALMKDVGGGTLHDMALLGGLLVAIYAFMQFICSPAIGALSDRFGRKPIIIVTLFLLSLDYLVMAVSTSYILILLARGLSGIMGSTWSVANSYVADTVPVDKRSAAFGLVSGIGALGFVAGPLASGALASIDFRLPLYVASAAVFLIAAVGILVMRESHYERRSSRRPIEVYNPFLVLHSTLRDPVVKAVLATMFLLQLASQSLFSVWAFYVVLKFNWTPAVVGIVLAIYGIAFGAAQVLLTGRFTRRFGNRNTALIGMAVGVLGYIGLVLAHDLTSMLAVIIFSSIAGITFPALQGLVTSEANPAKQGELQGSIGSLIALSALSGPILMSYTFSLTADPAGLDQPEATFVLSSILALLAAIIALRFARSRHSAEESV